MLIGILLTAVLVLLKGLGVQMEHEITWAQCFIPFAVNTAITFVFVMLKNGH